MKYQLIQVKSMAETRAVLAAMDQQGLKWIMGTPAAQYEPPFLFDRYKFSRFLVINKTDDGREYLQFEHHTEDYKNPNVLSAAQYINAFEGVRTIPFGSLKKGQIFRFSGQKKVFEVEARLKKEISYFPHSNIWGDYRQKKKSSALTVEVGFTY